MSSVWRRPDQAALLAWPGPPKSSPSQLGCFSAPPSVPKAPQPGPMALTKEERLPPEPRLQAAPGFAITTEDGQRRSLERDIPQREYEVLRKQWEENLKTGLKDQLGRVVGMPIDAAIDKVVSGEGLPTQVKGSSGKLSDYAISMPTAASSGRETEKRVQ